MSSSLISCHSPLSNNHKKPRNAEKQARQQSLPPVDGQSVQTVAVCLITCTALLLWCYFSSLSLYPISRAAGFHPGDRKDCCHKVFSAQGNVWPLTLSPCPPSCRPWNNIQTVTQLIVINRPLSFQLCLSGGAFTGSLADVFAAFYRLLSRRFLCHWHAPK